MKKILRLWKLDVFFTISKIVIQNYKITQEGPSCHLFQDGFACVPNSLTVRDLFNYILTIIYRSTYYIISLSTMESICQSYFLIVNNLLTVPDPFYFRLFYFRLWLEKTNFQLFSSLPHMRLMHQSFLEPFPMMKN